MVQMSCGTVIINYNAHRSSVYSIFSTYWGDSGSDFRPGWKAFLGSFSIFKQMLQQYLTNSPRQTNSIPQIVTLHCFPPAVCERQKTTKGLHTGPNYKLRKRRGVGGRGLA